MVRSQASQPVAVLPDRDVASESVAALRHTLGQRLTAVVLFGSRARGDAREDSDWDLLVIAEELPERVFERQKQLTLALPEMLRGTVTCLAKTPAEFEAALPSLYLDIALDGRILYDPQGYAAHKLETLQSLIHRKGLERKRTSAGDQWTWQTPPIGRWQLDWDS